jgi:xanthine dehydrogenase accessory factor
MGHSEATILTDPFMALLRSLNSGQEAVLTTTLTKAGIERRLEPGAGPIDPDLKPYSMTLTTTADRTVMTELFSPRPRMVVFGGGHISLALAPMAAAMNFELIIYDDRPSFSSPARFPQADRTICDSFESVGRNLSLTGADYAVIVTRGHRHDEECLRFVLGGPEPRYTGMIGSRRRVAIVRRQMAEEGHDKARLEALRSPIGLPIGAVTPPEIAVSIMAEIIKRKRENDQGGERCELEGALDMALLRFLAGPRREDMALVTVLSTKGSTPRRAGAKMAVHFDGRTVGSVGGGCSEAAVIGKARSLIGTGGHELTEVDLTDSAEEDGMVCGGLMEILIEDLKANQDPGTLVAV